MTKGLFDPSAFRKLKTCTLIHKYARFKRKLKQMKLFAQKICWKLVSERTVTWKGFYSQTQITLEAWRGGNQKVQKATPGARSAYCLHYLLLKSTGYQPPQLRQTVIDSVSSALLNYLWAADKNKGGHFHYDCKFQREETWFFPLTNTAICIYI